MWVIEHILAFIGTMSLLALLVSGATLTVCVLRERRRQERERLIAMMQALSPIWWIRYPEVGKFLWEFCFEHDLALEE